MSKWQKFAVVLLVLPLSAKAASDVDWPMEPFSPDLEDVPSLQRGAALYMNYCLGCHSLKFQRYERTADDLQIPHDLALENLVFTGQKIGGLITTSMAPERAKNWFGGPPPDLTMVTRVRDPGWVYNYLKTFYLDDSRPFGVNNKVFPNVGMPHALIELQGAAREVQSGYKPRDIVLGNGELIPRYALEVDDGAGGLNAEEYDEAIHDLVNFLYYVGEPTRLERHRIGVYVLLFLVVFGVFTYLLNREYWKDVH